MNSSTVESEDSGTKNNLKETSEIPRTLGFLIAFAGVFFLVASLFSLITLVVLRATSGESGALSSEEIYASILTFTTILTTISAIYIGYKLIKQLDIGRRLFNIFTVIVIVLAWGRFVYQQNEITKSFANVPVELAANLKQTELDSAMTVFILPAVLVIIVVLLNIKRSRSALQR